jgi:4-aminobutyrate aminotransferase-like enzyme
MANFQFSTDPVSVPFVDTQHRRIQTQIPAPGTADILDKLSKYESRSMHGQLPIVWDKALDFNVYDRLGNCWIDFTSTIFVANVGHSNPRVIDAIKKSIDIPLLGCYAYPNEIRADYLEKLVKFAGHNFEKAFLLSAGTEATEAAYKLMKMHAQKLGKSNSIIIGVSGNWHGRTMGAQLMSDNPAQRKWITNTKQDIEHISFPYPWKVSEIESIELLRDELSDLEKSGISLKNDVAGFMLETFQGWGAVFYPKGYVQEIRRICSENDILLCFDEMQSGFGRTGKNFGYEHYEVEADLICCGKGMGGGLPLSGVIGSGIVMDLPEVGNMSSTHSGNPMLCAVGTAVLEELDSRKLVSESERLGNILHSKLSQLMEKYPKLISGIQGRGMIAAILFTDPDSGLPNPAFVSQVAEKCMQKGLLVVHTGRESIKIGPPLTIPDSALLEGIEVLREAIQETLN